jgi:hypothetical protein
MAGSSSSGAAAQVPFWWRRFGLAVVLAHFAGALGFAVTATAAALLMGMVGDGGTPPPEGALGLPLWLLWMVLATLSATAMGFMAGAHLLLPITLCAIPVAFLVARYLAAGLLLTTLVGGLLGVVVGAPLGWLFYGVAQGDAATSLALYGFSAGVFFVQPLWSLCIRPRVAPDPPLPLTRRQWWIAAAVIGIALLPFLVLV